MVSGLKYADYVFGHLRTPNIFVGELVYIENVGVPMLIINSYDAAMDLLNKRSAIYSSRPQLIMTCELCDIRSL